jgi:hypothetical protein
MTTRTPPTAAATPAAWQPLPRRHFGLLLSSAGLALLAACSKSPDPAMPAVPAPADPVPAPAPSADLPLLDPADPTAKARAYVADATTLDAARNPPFQAGQACANCAIYAGQAGQPAGPCPLYARRQVSAQGWCNAYVKKSG